MNEYFSLKVTIYYSIYVLTYECCTYFSSFRFVYLNEIDDVQSAIKAALTFDSKILLESCTTKVLSDLSYENACGRLVDFQKYEFIRLPIMDFIKQNIKFIKATKDWPLLCKYPDIIAEMLEMSK